MTEQAGHLNAPDLVEECARADVNGYHEGNADWDEVNIMQKTLP